MDLGLRDRRVLITGGSKGIGRACAESFAAEGARLVLVARNQDALDRAAAELREAYGCEVEVLAADLASPDARAAAFESVPDVDILVNNAGAIPAGDLFAISLERWTEAWQLKVFGFIHLTQLYLAGMRERGAGTIVNVIGSASRTPRWSYVCGATGNAALVAFTEAVGAQSVEWNVRVFGINPSATRTDRIVSISRTRAQAKLGDESRWQEVLGSLPFGRLAEAAEIAGLCAMLCSPRVAYVSGTVVDVDGGARNREA